MNINIYSEYGFLIDIKGQTYELDRTNHLCIENCTNSLTLRAYPTDQTKLSIPFAFNLKMQNNKIICNLDNVKVYNIGMRCDVFIMPFLIPSIECVYSQTHIVKNVRYTVSAYTDRIKVVSSKGEYVFQIPLSDAQSEVNGNYIYILTKQNKKTLVCFDTSKNIFNSITADFIDLKEKNIMARVDLEDMAHHTKILTLKNDLTIEKSEMYIDESLSRKCYVNELVPYNFFEALMCKDDKNAIKFLSDDLKNAISDQNIYEFFGKYYKINITSLSPLIYTLYYPDSAKDFKITVNDEKITEIED